MHCKKCGSALTEDGAFCPSCGAKTKKQGKKPFFLFRPFLHLASFLLYLVLLVSLLATALLADAKILTSSGGVETILTHLVTSGSQTPHTTPPAMGAAGVVLLGNADLPDDPQIPDGALSDSGALAEFVREMVQQILGEEVSITPEQVQTFLEESTVMEFVAEKAASMAQNILTGQSNTDPIITTEDILQLMDDNRQLIENTFQIELTEETKQEMSAQIDDALADADMNAVLQEGITQALQTPVPGTNGMTVQDILGYIQRWAQLPVILTGAALCLLLIGLLLLLNYYQLHRGLRWSASACITAGTVLSVPLAIIQFSPALVSGMMPETGETLRILSGAAAVMAPVHYGLLALGTVMMIVSFLWRLFTRKK